MNNILHHIPGHLRLNSRAFNRAACDPVALKSSLETLPGVSSVELHDHAEDLIIRYDPARLTPVTLMDKVARHGIAAHGPKMAGFTGASALR